MTKTIQTLGSLGSRIGDPFGAVLRRLVVLLSSREYPDLTPSELEVRFKLLLECGF
jgi:hypothetical protein